MTHSCLPTPAQRKAHPETAQTRHSKNPQFPSFAREWGIEDERARSSLGGEST